MTRLLPLAIVADKLGYAPAYVRRIAADQGRPASERRYGNTYHERFPAFQREPGRKGYVITEAALNAFLARRNRTIERPL